MLGASEVLTLMAEGSWWDEPAESAAPEAAPDEVGAAAEEPVLATSCKEAAVADVFVSEPAGSVCVKKFRSNKLLRQFIPVGTRMESPSHRFPPSLQVRLVQSPAPGPVPGRTHRWAWWVAARRGKEGPGAARSVTPAGAPAGPSRPPAPPDCFPLWACCLALRRRKSAPRCSPLLQSELKQNAYG